MRRTHHKHKTIIFHSGQIEFNSSAVQRVTPTQFETDVLVIGGGPAGGWAALLAKLQGAEAGAT